MAMEHLSTVTCFLVFWPGPETNFEISQGLIHPIHPGFNAKKHGRTGLFRGVLASAPPNLTDLTSSSPSILSATWQNKSRSSIYRKKSAWLKVRKIRKQL